MNSSKQCTTTGCEGLSSPTQANTITTAPLDLELKIEAIVKKALVAELSDIKASLQDLTSLKAELSTVKNEAKQLTTAVKTLTDKTVSLEAENLKLKNKIKQYTITEKSKNTTLRNLNSIQGVIMY